MSDIFPVNGNMDYRSYAVTFYAPNTEVVHKFAVACGNFTAVDSCRNSVSADFLDIGNSSAVDMFSVCLLQTLAYRVRRRAFRKGCIFKDFIFVDLVMMNRRNFENAFCQSPRFIKNDIFRSGKGFKIVRTFYKDAFFA